MKRKILLTFGLILSLIFTLKAQDTIRIKHTNYTTIFSKSLKYPVLVEWYVTKAKIGCSTPLTRKDQFQPDPLLLAETNLLKDYVGSGTDRGHNMPAAENLCQGDKIQTECFYFSNMTPQYHSLNAGDWKSLETLERQIASEQDSVHVWCGSVGVAKKIGQVSVPTQCWKVIYIVKTKEYQAYIFNNTDNKQLGLSSHLVKLSIVESLSGFKFN
jgi:endonuclease G